MDFLTTSFWLLLGAAAGSWYGYAQGLAQGKKEGKQAGIKEGIKTYLSQELAESKTLGGSGKIELKALQDAQADIRKKLLQDGKKKTESSWLAWVVLGLGLLVLWAIF